MVWFSSTHATSVPLPTVSVASFDIVIGTLPSCPSILSAETVLSASTVSTLFEAATYATESAPPSSPYVMEPYGSSTSPSSSSYVRKFRK